MNDKFDIYNWRFNLRLRDNQLNENITPSEIQSKLKIELEKIFPHARNIKIDLPSENIEGKIRIDSKQDLEKEDIPYIESILNNFNFKLNKQKSNYYYDMDKDRYFYPTLVFTYL